MPGQVKVSWAEVMASWHRILRHVAAAVSIHALQSTLISCPAATNQRPAIHIYSTPPPRALLSPFINISMEFIRT